MNMSAAPQFTREVDRGEFIRQPNRFTDRLEPVAGRYVLYVSLACPWAHRSVIVRRLLGLDDAIALRVVDPIRDDAGWRFTLDPGGVDPTTGVRYLAELYRRSDPHYTGRVTVPAVWDTHTGRIATNDYPALTLQLETTFSPLHAPGAPDLYPTALRADIDTLNDAIYRDVNNGVYRCGFATTQDAYERAFTALFARLDQLEHRLGEQRYLLGEHITEADVRLYTTLARFDAVYHGHFKCNQRKLIEYPNLWAYARDLYQIPAFGETTDFDHIKRHYYATHERINPTRIVPLGPDLSGWTAPHNRAST
jgi:putative glutathione S-transferase